MLHERRALPEYNVMQLRAFNNFDIAHVALFNKVPNSKPLFVIIIFHFSSPSDWDLARADAMGLQRVLEFDCFTNMQSNPRKDVATTR